MKDKLDRDDARHQMDEAPRRGVRDDGAPKRTTRKFETQTANLGPSLVGDIVNASEVIDQIEGPFHR